MLITQVEKMIDTGFALMPRFKPSAALAEGTCLVAHRGAHDNKHGIIENTMTAFRRAQQAGCWGIELDVHLTADEVLVVNHDPSLLRLWGHNVGIANLNFADLRILAPEIPSLIEVVAEFGQKMHLFIELKTSLPNDAILLQCLQGLYAIKDYHILTLDAAIFQSLSAFHPQALLLVAVHNNVRELGHLSLSQPYGGLLGHYLLMTNNLLSRLSKENQLAGVGFVDSKYSLYREINRGVSLIFTNNALPMSSYLKSLY